MPQRFGDAEHRHILAIGDARKAVAQPVERDRRETLHGDELRDALAQNVRLIRLSRLVDGDVALWVIFRVLLPPPLPVAVQPLEQRFKVLIAAKGQPSLGRVGLRCFFKRPAAHGSAHLADLEHASL